MAPEIFRKAGHGKPVDIWAIGVITYVSSVVAVSIEVLTLLWQVFLALWLHAV